MMLEAEKKSEFDQDFVDINDILWWAIQGKKMMSALRDKGMTFVIDDETEIMRQRLFEK